MKKFYEIFYITGITMENEFEEELDYVTGEELDGMIASLKEKGFSCMVDEITEEYYSEHFITTTGEESEKNSLD